MAGCAASHNVHVAVSVALDPVDITEEGFQEGANATIKLDQVDGARLGHQGARKIAQYWEREWRGSAKDQGGESGAHRCRDVTQDARRMEARKPGTMRTVECASPKVKEHEDGITKRWENGLGK